jgi:hypothetical protein
MIEDGLGFELVPWQRVLGRWRATLRGYGP